jgi:hypothetical protein
LRREGSTLQHPSRQGESAGLHDIGISHDSGIVPVPGRPVKAIRSPPSPFPRARSQAGGFRCTIRGKDGGGRKTR